MRGSYWTRLLLWLMRVRRLRRVKEVKRSVYPGWGGKPERKHFVLVDRGFNKEITEGR